MKKDNKCMLIGKEFMCNGEVFDCVHALKEKDYRYKCKWRGDVCKTAALGCDGDFASVYGCSNKQAQHETLSDVFYWANDMLTKHALGEE